MSLIERITAPSAHYGGLSLEARMAECRTPAVSIAVVAQGKLAEAGAFGVKRRGERDKATADTLFQAASISKPVFAVAVMALGQRGLLDLDTDVAEYLRDYTLPTLDGKRHAITLRQLLSHHAGLNLHGFAGYIQGQAIPTLRQILMGEPPANHVALKPVLPPETEFRYSGGGYMLAQKTVTDLTQRDVCSLMEELVFEPVAMSGSTVRQPLPQDKLGSMAYGYNAHDLELPGGCCTMPEIAAAGLWTTPSDLCRLGMEVMEALAGGGRCLSQASARQMTTPAYPGSPYGVGFAVDTCKQGATFGHGGSNVGYRCNAVFCPQDGSGIVVMQNSDIGSPIPLEVTEVFKEVCGW